MDVTWYVIKHIPTGKIIPCASGKMERGGSWVEPEDPKVALPKVFSEKRYAKGWLTSWLKGAVTMHWSTDWESGHQEGRLETVSKPHRKREEYKIVPLSFRIGS